MDSISTRKKKDTSIGRDEMNLLEYCFASATNRVDKQTRSLVFEDQVWCKHQRLYLPKRLTMAFSAEYGRPTSRDDQILTACMKLTKDAGFADPRVSFTRYQILEELGWADEGKNYGRIEDGFDRIRGVHLSWEHAFWDKAEEDWVTIKFSILDQVGLLDRGRCDRVRERSGERYPRSWFTWSDVMFQSFVGGYIKKLDMEMLRSIDGDVAKRLYRWLDKHFNNDKRKLPIEIPVKMLATRKLGFKPNKPSHLVRMLEPSIDELVRIGYVHRDSNRFREKNGEVIAAFQPGKGVTKTDVRKPKKQEPSLNEMQRELASELAKVGVTAGSGKTTCADSLARAYQAKKIRRCIAYFVQVNGEAKTRQGEKSVGWLINCIMSEDENGFVPESFKTPAELLAKRTADKKQREAERAKERAEAEINRREMEESQVNFVTYRDSFTEEEQLRLEDQMLAELGSKHMVTRQVIRARSRSGDLGMFHQTLWMEYIKPRQDEAGNTAPKVDTERPETLSEI